VTCGRGGRGAIDDGRVLGRGRTRGRERFESRDPVNPSEHVLRTRRRRHRIIYVLVCVRVCVGVGEWVSVWVGACVCVYYVLAVWTYRARRVKRPNERSVKFYGQSFQTNPIKRRTKGVFICLRRRRRRRPLCRRSVPLAQFRVRPSQES